MEKKREVSVLIPYKIQTDGIFVYLQKREKDRKTLPGHFAFFGGGVEEGETPIQTLEREIQEELCFTPKGYEFLGKYDFSWLANVYFLKVDDNFEKGIKVMEGDYGKFFSETEVANEPMMIDEDKSILKDLYKILAKKIHE